VHILVDKSVWIDYFKSGQNSKDLDILIDYDLHIINEVILTEKIPFLTVRKQTQIIELLDNIIKLPLQINWYEIRDFQIKCIQYGVNGIGIPDLIITQHSIQNNIKLYSLDKHFQILKKVVGVELFP